MKASALYLMTIILLLSWCSGCSQHVPPKSGIEAKTVNPPTTNTNDLEAKTNQDGNGEWKAYRSILSGNFTLINEDDCKSEMEYLYKMDSQNGKCEWKYILMDFNKDGSDELFIQLTPDHDSALLRYEDGNIECIYIDDLEMNCFTQPLKGGKLLGTYNYWIAPNKTICELDSEFKSVNEKCYTSITVDDYEYYKEHYSVIMDQYPSITKEGVYYFQEIGGKVTELPKEDWERIQKDIAEQIVSDIEWKDCSELSAS
jgi:hypothetical protein